MVSVKVIAAAVALAAVIGCAAFFLVADEGPEVPVLPDGPDGPDEPNVPDGPDEPNVPDNPDVPSVPDGQHTLVEGSTLDWTQWLGGTSSPGVTDSKTPIRESDMNVLWKITGDKSGMMWKVPGTPICVGDDTYYYDVESKKIKRVETSTGKTVAETECLTSTVYNMAISCGDGKVFVPAFRSGCTVLCAFDADTLDPLFVSEPIEGGQVAGPVTYHQGKVYFGTEGGDFACFSSEDTDTGASDEVVSPLWIVESNGWYNVSPAFFGGDCVISDRGYTKPPGAVVRQEDTDKPGATAYLVDTDTGAVRDTMKFDMEFSLSGAVSYEGRAYLALTPNHNFDPKHYVTDGSFEPREGRLHSVEVRDGRFVESSEEVWKSSCFEGGFQSTPVIWNDRVYLGGGGSTMGTDEPVTVLQINNDGSLTEAYTADIQTKSHMAVTTAYSTPENGNLVYMYFIEYGQVYEGESSESSNGYAYIYCLSDREGQSAPKVEFRFIPDPAQFSFQSFTISQDGYLLVKNDICLFCFGNPSVSYGPEDLRSQIRLAVSQAGSGNQTVLFSDISERYSMLGDSDRAALENDWKELMDCTCTVTFGGDKVSEVRILKGEIPIAPYVADKDGKMFSGWTLDGRPWQGCSERVYSDIELQPAFVPAVTVTADVAGGEKISERQSEKGGPMCYLPVPVRDGWSFDGWYIGDVPCRPQYTVLEEDVVVTAHWLKDSVITFDPAGGPAVDPKGVTQDRPIGELEVPFKSGYRFEGWYDGDTLFTAETVYPYDHDITLKAHWTESQKTQADTGMGVKVTGRMPEGVEVSIAEKRGSGTQSIKVLRAAAGPDADLMLLGIYGGGIDGTQTFTVEMEAPASAEGRQADVFYYISGDSPRAVKVTGTVTDGTLTVELGGNTSSRGVQIEFAVPDFIGLSDTIKEER